jgi:hypothetical protein
MSAAESAPTIRLTSEAYLEMSREERAGALAEMIDCVFVKNIGGPKGPQAVPLNEERVQILWRGQGPSDLPRANRAGEVVPWQWPTTDSVSVQAA